MELPRARKRYSVKGGHFEGWLKCVVSKLFGSTSYLLISQTYLIFRKRVSFQSIRPDFQKIISQPENLKIFCKRNLPYTIVVTTCPAAKFPICRFMGKARSGRRFASPKVIYLGDIIFGKPPRQISLFRRDATDRALRKALSSSISIRWFPLQRANFTSTQTSCMRAGCKIYDPL